MDQTNALEVLADMPRIGVIGHTMVIGEDPPKENDLSKFKNLFATIIADEDWVQFLGWLFSYDGWKKADTLELYKREEIIEELEKSIKMGHSFYVTPRTSFTKVLYKLFGYQFACEEHPDGVDGLLFVNEDFYKKNFTPIRAKTFEVVLEKVRGAINTTIQSLDD